MDPHAFLEVASTLSTGMTEADWRSAVSRAYYGVFHVARQLLRHCGFVVPRADLVHAYLWLRLSNCGHPDVEKVGRGLKELRTARNEADYDLDSPLAHPEAVDWVDQALAQADLLDQVRATPSIQQQITDKIKEYEKNVLKQSTWKP